MSDLFDAPATGAPRADGVGVAGALSWRGETLAFAAAARVRGESTADAVGGASAWRAGLPPQRPADADPEDEDADDLNDDLEDDEDDEADALDEDDEDDEDEDDELDDEYDNDDDDDDRTPGRSDDESD